MLAEHLWPNVSPQLAAEKIEYTGRAGIQDTTGICIGAAVQNIEVKTPLHDREQAVARLAALGARQMWTRRQVDTFFRVSSQSGWLKLRESEGCLSA